MLDVYYRSEIRNMLVAALGLAATATGDPILLAGIVMFARFWAKQFGLSWPGIVADVKADLIEQDKRWFQDVIDGRIIDNGDDL